MELIAEHKSVTRVWPEFIGKCQISHLAPKENRFCMKRVSRSSPNVSTCWLYLWWSEPREEYWWFAAQLCTVPWVVVERLIGVVHSQGHVPNIVETMLRYYHNSWAQVRLNQRQSGLRNRNNRSFCVVAKHLSIADSKRRSAMWWHHVSHITEAPGHANLSTPRCSNSARWASMHTLSCQCVGADSPPQIV